MDPTVFDRIRAAQIADAGDYVENPTEAIIKTVTDNLRAFLVVKNRRYGNSAINPTRIFSKADNLTQLQVRIDDKLSRILNNDELRKNDLVDLMGYLVLLCVALGYTDFNDLID